MSRVAVVGHLCLDVAPVLPGPPVVTPGVLSQIGPAAVSLGGAVANTGRTLAVLGVPVVAWAAVGDDHFGELIRRLLDGVPRLEFRPQVVAGGSSYTVVVEPPGVDRTFWHHPGSNAALDLAVVTLDDADLLHFGYPSLLPGVCADGGAALRELLTRATADGVVTSLDLAWVDPHTTAAQVDWELFLRAVLPVTDLLTPSYDDLASALGLPAAFDPVRGRRLVEQLLDWGAGVVVLTAGADGMLLGAADRQRLRRLERYPLDVDAWAGARMAAPAVPLGRIGTTTGAGDAATAGLLAALRAGRGPGDAVAFAAAVAAAVIEQGGTGSFTGLR